MPQSKEKGYSDYERKVYAFHAGEIRDGWFLQISAGSRCGMPAVVQPVSCEVFKLCLLGFADLSVFPYVFQEHTETVCGRSGI